MLLKADEVWMSKTILGYWLLSCIDQFFFWCIAGLHNLSLLNLEGCPVTAACLDSLSGGSSPYAWLFLEPSDVIFELAIFAQFLNCYQHVLVHYAHQFLYCFYLLVVI